MRGASGGGGRKGRSMSKEGGPCENPSPSGKASIEADFPQVYGMIALFVSVLLQTGERKTNQDNSDLGYLSDSCCGCADIANCRWWGPYSLMWLDISPC